MSHRLLCYSAIPSHFDDCTSESYTISLQAHLRIGSITFRLREFEMPHLSPILSRFTMCRFPFPRRE